MFRFRTIHLVSVDDSKIVLDFKYEIFEFFYNETQRLFTNDFVGNIRREKGTSEKGILPRTDIVGTGVSKNFRQKITLPLFLILFLSSCKFLT